MDLRQTYLSADGRMARLPYLGFALLLTLPYMLAVYLLAGLFGSFSTVFVLALYAIVAYPYYCLMAKRLQDFNQPGKFAIAIIGVGILASILQFVEALHGVAMIISAAQAIVGLAILLVPGTAGENSYGAAPSSVALA